MLLQGQKNRLNNLTYFEQKARTLGFAFIAGVDEVGRGSIAGPVYAAACMIQTGTTFTGIRDSKALSKKKREHFYFELTNHPKVVYAIGEASVEEIDQYNILNATKLAMIRAVKELPIPPDYLLIDALKIDLPITQEAIIKGDTQSISIMGASIIAKVTRDRLMVSLDQQFSGYGFAQNMGYGTEEHRRAIKQYGQIKGVHRTSFRLKHESSI